MKFSATAIALASACLAAAAPTSFIDWHPPVLEPTKETVWKEGSQANVSWSQDVPDSYKNQVGTHAKIILGWMKPDQQDDIGYYLNFTHPLLDDVSLFDGPNYATVDVPTGLNLTYSYTVVLYGSTGDHSDFFKITA